MISVGLRIDVDTLRGTRIGVPNLVSLFSRYAIKGTFFFSVGPDNMGRHLFRLLRPAFLVKMVRTRAASLYGWDILLRGTLFPGPVIGRRCSDQIRETFRMGHEIGLHAWDHHLWQTAISRMRPEILQEEIRKGMELLTEITGRPPVCFAAPAWRVTREALQVLQDFPFAFQSDCRGHSLFRPVIDGMVPLRVQVPVTLPTYDEVVGMETSPGEYNDYILGKIRPGRLNVLTIHAEAEGIGCLEMFKDFLSRAKENRIRFQPLGKIVEDWGVVPVSGMKTDLQTGREGWISVQGNDR